VVFIVMQNLVGIGNVVMRVSMLYEFGLKIHAPVGGVFGVKVGQTEAFFSNFQSPAGYGHDPIHTQKIRSEGQFDKYM